MAIKTIKQPYIHDPVSRERFLLEAEITGLLEHPGIVPVYSMGRDHEHRPYYAMRLIKGETLKEAIRRFHQADATPGRVNRWHSLELRQLLGRFVAVCNTVAYAHSRGVIHRDLKPDNVLLGPYGETLVADWGLAKVVGRTDPQGPIGPTHADDTSEPTIRPEAAGMDPTRGALGTPQYGTSRPGDTDRIGPASDIYSLGAILYRILTGRPPVAKDRVEVMLEHARDGDFPRPGQVRKDIPSRSRPSV